MDDYTCLNNSPKDHRSIPLKPFIIIWENILQFIAGIAARAGEMETGGELYGLLSHAGRPVIMLATPPGPGAVHERGHFCQDLEYMREINACLTNRSGIQYIGNWHHHHYMLKVLSGGDIRSTHAIAQNNQYKKMCQLVLTFEGEPFVNYQSDSIYRKSSWTSHESEAKQLCYKRSYFSRKHNLYPDSKTASIRVNAFVYSDARYSQPTLCPIKVLPGVSPFTYAISRESAASESTVYLPHPSSKIIFDSLEAPNEPTAQSSELPQVIEEQCSLLPKKAREHIEIVNREDLVFLCLPLPEKDGEVVVAYQKKKFWKVISVYLMVKKPVEKEPVEITSVTFRLNHGRKLSTIYNRAVRLHKTRSFDFKNY